jgi:hypothetical protein
MRLPFVVSVVSRVSRPAPKRPIRWKACRPHRRQTALRAPRGHEAARRRLSTRQLRPDDSGAILRALLEVLGVVASELTVYLPGTGRQLQTAVVPLEQPNTPHDPWRALDPGAPLPSTLHLFPRRTGERS